ncbi:unnamed protein product, partial [Sphacelaria rigidula]
LLSAIDPVTRLRPRERLSIGLLGKHAASGVGKGVEVLYNGVLDSLMAGNEPLGIRCLLGLGELCREVECAELLGAIGGHTTILRLMSDGKIPGNIRLRQPTNQRAAALRKTLSGDGVEKCNRSNSVDLDDGEEDEVQAAAAEVAARVVSSGCAFPMRSAFPGDTSDLMSGRYPLEYDFIIPGGDRFSTLDSFETTGAITTEAFPPSNLNVSEGRPVSILVRPVKERQHSQFDVGFQMWPAAVILSRWLCAHPGVLRGRSVLEVGAGLGLCGITAAHLASTVTLSDFNPKVLRALEANVALNAGWTSNSATQPGERGEETGDSGSAIDVPGRVRVRHLDWDLLRVPDLMSGSEDEEPAVVPGPSTSSRSGVENGHDALGAGDRGGDQDEQGEFDSVEDNVRFDVIIASDHICQVSAPPQHCVRLVTAIL